MLYIFLPGQPLFASNCMSKSILKKATQKNNSILRAELILIKIDKHDLRKHIRGPQFSVAVHLCMIQQYYSEVRMFCQLFIASLVPYYYNIIQ